MMAIRDARYEFMNGSARFLGLWIELTIIHGYVADFTSLFSYLSENSVVVNLTDAYQAMTFLETRNHPADKRKSVSGYHKSVQQIN